MSGEKKNTATEESKQEVHDLTDKELAQVTGGNVVLPGTHDAAKNYAGRVIFDNSQATGNGGAVISSGNVELGENVRFTASNER